MRQLSTKFDRFHTSIRSNKWLGYFTIFLRIPLAYAFLVAGFTKVNGERFTSLSNNHPMGHYLEALFHTGFYYPFIGAMQMLAAVLLLIPRTALLGAILYFPIILNICLLSYAVRFDGSMLTSPLMVLANLYLLCWDYQRWKYILPVKKSKLEFLLPEKPGTGKKFAFKFLSFVFLTMVVTVALVFTMHKKVILPRNHIGDCETQCPDSSNPEACAAFCECIHNEGNSLDDCLEKYGNKFKK